MPPVSAHSEIGHTNPNYQTLLLSFKPRQVLLAQKNSEAMTMKPCSTKTPALNPDQKDLLLHSVIQYLDINGFSRALKRLLTEAQIENESWKTCSLNLEVMYGKYLETCTHVNTNFNTCKEQGAEEQTVGKKKKKRSDESDNNAAANQSEISESAKNSREIVSNDLLTDSNVELKMKKKSKKVSDSLCYTEQGSAQAIKKPIADTDCELETDEYTEKQKDKKKKKSKSISESLGSNVEQVRLDSLPTVNEEKCKNLGDSKIDSNVEVKSKDKKKKNKLTSNSVGNIVEHCGLGDENGLLKDKVEQEHLASLPVVASKGDNKTDSEIEGKSKEKKKKKKKQITDSLIENIGQCDAALENMLDIPLEEKKLESKDEKRKKKGSVSETLSVGVAEVPNKQEPIKGDLKETFHIAEDTSDWEKKSSKKRKRLSSDENEEQLFDKLAGEELKRRKAEHLEETKSIGDNEHAGKGSKGENGKENKGANGLVGQFELQNSAVKLAEVHGNGDFQNNGDNSAAQKTRRNQHDGSAEPKTVHVFQRVKMDQVEYANEKLQDNSYWAKGGAEVGYGAKAQEILEQVRGRDFRHEKTKKKRGSYRGGQIDLQAHSVKFNYSDED